MFTLGVYSVIKSSIQTCLNMSSAVAQLDTRQTLENTLSVILLYYVLHKRSPEHDPIWDPARSTLLKKIVF
jgi:hypothetical protein